MAFALLRSLKDESRGVASAAAEALGALRSREAVPDLIVAVRVQHLPAAAIALGRIGDARAFDPLVAAAAIPEVGEDVVAEALGLLGDRRATPWLIERTAKSRPVRRTAILALGQLKDPLALEPMAALLTSTDWGVATSAAAGLGLSADPRAVGPLAAAYGRSLDAANWDLREATGAALASFGPLAVASVADLLQSRPRDRADVLRTLRRFGPEANPALIAALEFDEPYARTLAAEALAERDDPRVEAALQARLDRSDVRAVGGAYRFFLKHLDERAVDALLRAMAESGFSSDQADAFVASGHPRLVKAGQTYICGALPERCR